MTDPLHRALSYPYAFPNSAYVLSPNDRVLAWEAPDLASRTPVIAAGSNRAPEQLRRKFEGMAEELPVEVRCLEGFDVVHSAHVSAYGAIPATLAPDPGCVVEVGVTWLTERQLLRMHETEALGVNYAFGELVGANLFTYVSLWGALPWALEAVTAEGRSRPAMSQEAVQRAVRDRIAPGRALEDFVAEAVADAGLRDARKAALRAHAAPIVLPGFARR